MAEEKKNWLGPYVPEGSFIRELIQQVKLAYHLMLDGRVPALAKLAPVAALAYLVLPFDVSPDVVPVLGQLDDVAVILLGLRLLFEFSPPEVVQEYLRRLAETIGGNWEIVDDPPPSSSPPPSQGEVEEGNVRPDK